MSVGVLGSGSVVVDLVMPKLKSPGKKPPGARVNVDNWELVGVVVAVPSYPDKFPMSDDRSYDGVLYVGGLNGYVGLMKRGRDKVTAKYPPSKYSRYILGINKDLLDKVFDAFCDNSGISSFALHAKGGVFYSGAVVTKTCSIAPISVVYESDLIYGFQWAWLTYVTSSYRKGDDFAGLGVVAKNVHGRQIKMSGGFGVTAGWRAWCVATGRGYSKKGSTPSAKEIVRSFLEGLPSRYIPFKRVRFGDEWLDAD